MRRPARGRRSLGPGPVPSRQLTTTTVARSQFRAAPPRRGSIFYPAEDDGADQPFNRRLAKLGRVPLVVCVHGNHDPSVPSFRGYDYFQTALARAGFIAVSVDENETNGNTGGPQNITLPIRPDDRIDRLPQQLDANGPIFKAQWTSPEPA